MSIASDIFSPLTSAIVTYDVDAAVAAIESDLCRHYDSAELPHAFLELIGDLPDEWPEFVWRALHRLWPSFDCIPHDAYSHLFLSLRYGWRRDYFDADDGAFYAGLPDRLTVYRGQCASAPVGLSWTLERGVALEFARGHRGIWNRHPILLGARIRKTQIAGAYAGRNEAEIVTFRPPRPAYWPLTPAPDWGAQ